MTGAQMGFTFPVGQGVARARKRGYIAAQACADAADRRDPNWTEQAFRAFKDFINLFPERKFTTEDVRLAAVNSVPPPKDGRAWGQIVLKAKREGLIKPVGYRGVESSNGSPKVLWQRAQLI